MPVQSLKPDAFVTDWIPQFAERVSTLKGSEIRELLKLLERPDIISFAGGVPDPGLFPKDALKRAYDELLDDPALAATALQYGMSEGWGPLREQIAAAMSAKGVRCDVENILITGGAQQAIEFSARAFVEPGSIILTQSPTFLGALQSFGVYRPRYRNLPQPGDVGSDRSNVRPCMTYAMADFQNPTGQSLSVDERVALVSLARDSGAPLIEDNPYGEIHFEAEPLPTLAAVDADGRHIDESIVIYCGTYSKVLAPGLRIGWMAAARTVIEKMVLLKQASDLQVSTINQLVAARLSECLQPERMDRVRAHYRVRRDAMLAALEREMPDGIGWTRPDGGLFVWLSLPEQADASALLPEAVRDGVAFVPGEPFYSDRSVRNKLRLSYSLADPERIDAGIRRLAAVFRRAL